MTTADKPEPVAWMIADGESTWVTQFEPSPKEHPYSEIIPLYTHPTSDLAERIEGLVEYVQHKDYAGCRKSDWDFDVPCTCGLDTLLAALKEENNHDQ